MSDDNIQDNVITPQDNPKDYTLSVASLDEVASVVSNPSLHPKNNADGSFMCALSQNIFFVGFMVAGKTSVCRCLSRRLSLPCVDMDAYIERHENTTINEIFATCGEEAFRDKETEVLGKAACMGPMLVSCGGGVVLREQNREIMRKSGFVVYLQVTAEAAAQRIGDVSTRPNFKNLEVAKKTIKARLPMYEDAASCSINTVGKSIEAVSDEVQQVLIERGILRIN